MAARLVFFAHWYFYDFGFFFRTMDVSARARSVAQPIQMDDGMEPVSQYKVIWMREFWEKSDS